MRVVFGAIVGGILLLFNEIIQDFVRNNNRKSTYKDALECSKKLGKRLIVIGDPHRGKGSSFHGVSYGSGDMTIDINGCSKGKCDVIQDDAYEVLKQLKTNSSVIFISCVLEYIEHIEKTIKEIRRVSGGNYFIVHVQPYTLTAFLYACKKESSSARNIIFKTKPNFVLWKIGDTHMTRI